MFDDQSKKFVTPEPYAPIKYADLLRQNAALGRATGTRFRVAVLANITIHPLKEILEFSLRSRGIDAVVTVGTYDNVAQDSIEMSASDAVVIFYEVAALADKLPFERHRLSARDVDAFIDKARQELSFVFDALRDTKVVAMNLLSALPFSMDSYGDTALERICDGVNAFAREHAPRSFKLLDIEKVLARCSMSGAVDLRLLLIARALYRFAFLRAYSEWICPLLALAAGRYRKVLVLDCDNTLWKGTLGEDEAAGLQMFREVQSGIVRLAQSGTLICLCSKNNPEDVEAALQHPDMLLRSEHLVVKAVNWNDKCQNLRDIAATLNLDLDSFVFVDDSDFELELVRQHLPMVATFKVPADYAEYLWMWQVIEAQFYKEAETAEDTKRTEQYQTEFLRQQQRTKFVGLDDYLASLKLVVRLTPNSLRQVSRLAQLTQKTNQFNLTTQRMTESELDSAMRSGRYMVLGVDVRDKLGDYGITGLVVVRFEGATAWIENFLLSCRVLGRNVEFRVFDGLISQLRARGAQHIHGTYRASSRNAQVKDFYSRMGFDLLGDDGQTRFYDLPVMAHKPSGLDYIELEQASEEDLDRLSSCSCAQSP